MKNPNEELMGRVMGLAAEIEALQPEKGPRDGNIAVAAGALITCRDNLRWHGESTLEREAKKKAESLQTATTGTAAE